MSETFVEKICGAKAGNIVVVSPHLVLSHDNTSSIYHTFKALGATKIHSPSKLVVVIDHNTPPLSAKIQLSHQQIRTFVKEQGVTKFHDIGEGICHQVMTSYAYPGAIIVGSDSHTCTAGAFNAFAVGIDRTETAAVWATDTIWFRVPESIKINLSNRLRAGVSAKDLVLTLIPLLKEQGSYRSLEFHGEGITSLTLADRMTITNMASELGAKNAVFPYDILLSNLMPEAKTPLWADEDATYSAVFQVDLDSIVPMIAMPHDVNRVFPLSIVGNIKIDKAILGTCSNGRIEDLRAVAHQIKGKKKSPHCAFFVVPASKAVLQQAQEEGVLAMLISFGADILTPSCGPCMGIGRGSAVGQEHIVSTSNRNFQGRMGSKQASIYLVSPETLAQVVVDGYLNKGFPTMEDSLPEEVSTYEQKTYYINGVWDFSAIPHMSTDAMFSGHRTYEVSSASPQDIIPYLLEKVDPTFSKAQAGDIILGGDNFGCGSSREHPAVGFSYLGIRYIIVKSVNRIFYRSAINQGIHVLVMPALVEAYVHGDTLYVDEKKQGVFLNTDFFPYHPLPAILQDIIQEKGLVQAVRKRLEMGEG